RRAAHAEAHAARAVAGRAPVARRAGLRQDVRRPAHGAADPGEGEARPRRRNAVRTAQGRRQGRDRRRVRRRSVVHLLAAAAEQAQEATRRDRAGVSRRNDWYGLGGGAVRPSAPTADHILPNLIVGEYPNIGDVPWLRNTLGVDAVICLQDDADLASK